MKPRYIFYGQLNEPCLYSHWLHMLATLNNKDKASIPLTVLSRQEMEGAARQYGRMIRVGYHNIEQCLDEDGVLDCHGELIAFSIGMYEYFVDLINHQLELNKDGIKHVASTGFAA